MGFFDNLRRSMGGSAPEKTMEDAVEEPKKEEDAEDEAEVETNESELNESIGEDGVIIESVKVVERDVVPEQIQEEAEYRQIKAYSEKKPVQHVIGQTKIMAIINQ